MTAQIEENLEKDSCIGILGLSFKPESNDVRDTPAAKVISGLVDDGYTNIIAYAPLAMEEFRQHYDLPIIYADSKAEVLEKADEVSDGKEENRNNTPSHLIRNGLG